MNGVYRGGSYLTAKTHADRCSGIRYDDWVRGYKTVNLGFRLNGVSRGGRAGHYAVLIRSSRRWDSYGYVIGNGNVGFRAVGEWCNKASV